MFGQKSGKRYKKPYYSITSKKAEKVMDICQQGELIGHLIIWTGEAKPNQCFTILQDGPYSYLRDQKTKRYLTVLNANDEAGVVTEASPNERSRFKIR